jgi:lipopolysaccharide/colanic/teichoic acid biosynthesis glycosyltransferase
LLLTVLRGRMSFVGPRPAEQGLDYTGPRRLMAPGLIGPGEARDDEYVERWTLLGDARLLAGRGTVHHSVSNSSS